MLNDLQHLQSGSFISHLIMVQCKCAACEDKFLTFEFEDDFLVVLHREEAIAASSEILKEHAIPSVRSSDLSEPYVEGKNEVQKTSEDFGESPVTNFEMGIDCLLWAWPFSFNGWDTGNEVPLKLQTREVGTSSGVHRLRDNHYLSSSPIVRAYTSHRGKAESCCMFKIRQNSESCCTLGAIAWFIPLHI